MTRHFLFGLGALLAVAPSARAADLLEPVDYQYVRICDAFGTGFYYIPGTDTCLRVGGYVRAEAHYVGGDVGLLYGVADANVNKFTTRARGQVNLDARTQTNIGLVRAYIALEMTVGPGSDTGVPLVTDVGDPNYDGTDASLASAFVQVSNDWGTYTAGHTGSFFDFFGSHGYGTRLQIDDNTGEQTLFAVTWTPGMSGMSFTLSAEDPASGGRKLNGADDYEGQVAPDGVANIRLDQDWGSAQVMGAVRVIHDNNGVAIGDDSGGEDYGIGWAAGAGLSVNLPGDWMFEAQGGYSEGALAYITTDPGGVGDFEGPDGDDQNTAWTLRGGFTGPVTENVTAWVDGSFTRAEQQTAGLLEYDFWAVQTGVEWEPVSGLAMGPEFVYNHLDYEIGGADYNVWGLMWRLQRSF